MRSYEEYKKILELWEQGYKKLQIEKLTGIPRETIRDCIKKFTTIKGLDEQYSQSRIRKAQEKPLDYLKNVQACQSYSYLLGLYLGDGHIAKIRRTYQLRIFNDSRYSNLIEQCVSAIKVVLPHNSVITNKKDVGDTCTVILVYSNLLPFLFPQHGAGEKHKRPIILQDWQKEILGEYPLEFIRGCIHSDGCRIDPVINGKVYSRYQFSNISTDIQRLFAETCDQLGIHWTFHGRNFTIARRKDVAYLDTVIGAKS